MNQESHLNNHHKGKSLVHKINHHKEKVTQMVSSYKLKLVMLRIEMIQYKQHLQIMVKKEVLQVEVVQSQEKVIQGKTQLHKILIIRKEDRNQGELEKVIINKQTMKLYLN